MNAVHTQENFFNSCVSSDINFNILYIRCRDKVNGDGDEYDKFLVCIEIEIFAWNAAVAALSSQSVASPSFSFRLHSIEAKQRYFLRSSRFFLLLFWLCLAHQICFTCCRRTCFVDENLITKKNVKSILHNSVHEPRQRDYWKRWKFVIFSHIFSRH